MGMFTSTLKMVLFGGLTAVASRNEEAPVNLD